jgi:hypothetical protein
MTQAVIILPRQNRIQYFMNEEGYIQEKEVDEIFKHYLRHGPYTDEGPMTDVKEAFLLLGNVSWDADDAPRASPTTIYTILKAIIKYDSNSEFESSIDILLRKEIFPTRAI